MEKLAWGGMKWGREVPFPVNPDLAEILGDMDFDVDNFLFDSTCLDFEVPKFWISQYPGFWISRFPKIHTDGRPGGAQMGGRAGELFIDWIL